jgi:hypothetical protein
VDRLAAGGGEHVVTGAASLGTYCQPLPGLGLAVISKYLHGFGLVLTVRDRLLLVVPSMRWPAMTMVKA